MDPWRSPHLQSRAIDRWLPAIRKPILPRDHTWLRDAFDRNPVLSRAFDNIAGSDWATREMLKRACLEFLCVYENFSTNRAHAREELLQQQEHIDSLRKGLPNLIRTPFQASADWVSDAYHHAFMALHRAIFVAEGRLISNRALATQVGYLAREGMPRNAALLKLIEVAGNCDTKVAALATELLNQIGVTLEVTAPQVCGVRRASGMVVIGATYGASEQ